MLIEAFVKKAFQVPLDAYRTFVIDKKYNVTHTTLDSFVYDLVVDAALMLLSFPPIILGYLWVVTNGGEYFYLSLLMFAILVTVLLTWLHPNLTAPLFNDLKPLKHSSVKDRLTDLCRKTKFPLGSIFMLKGNLRWGHSDASFYGLGRQKAIVVS